MVYPSPTTCRRRVARALVESGLSHEAAAAYLAGLMASGPLASNQPAWVPASFAQTFRPRSGRPAEEIAAALRIVVDVELDHVIGRAP